MLRTSLPERSAGGQSRLPASGCVLLGRRRRGELALAIAAGIYVLMLIALPRVAPAQATEPQPSTISHDSFGKLPPEARTPRLTRLFAQVQRKNAVPIRFTRSDLSTPNLVGQTSFYAHETVVKYADISGALLENVLAHELGHILLRQQGISIDAGIRGPRNEFLQALCDSISSAAEDFLIVKMMLGRGFRPQILWEHSAQNLLHPHNIPPEIARGDGFQRHAGLRLFDALDERRLLGRRVTITSEQLEAAAVALNPGIVRYEHKYFDAVETLDCTDAASCFATTKRIRDAVGFANIVIKNPSTGNFE
jgi:hypothetical protein